MLITPFGFGTFDVKAGHAGLFSAEQPQDASPETQGTAGPEEPYEL